MTTLEGERKDLNCYELTMLVMVEIFPTLNGREGESREFTYLNLRECLSGGKTLQSPIGLRVDLVTRHPSSTSFPGPFFFAHHQEREGDGKQHILWRWPYCKLFFVWSEQGIRLQFNFRHDLQLNAVPNTHNTVWSKTTGTIPLTIPWTWMNCLGCLKSSQYNLSTEPSNSSLSGVGITSCCVSPYTCCPEMARWRWCS